MAGSTNVTPYVMRWCTLLVHIPCWCLRCCHGLVPGLTAALGGADVDAGINAYFAYTVVGYLGTGKVGLLLVC